MYDPQQFWKHIALTLHDLPLIRTSGSSDEVLNEFLNLCHIYSYITEQMYLGGLIFAFVGSSTPLVMIYVCNLAWFRPKCITSMCHFSQMQSPIHRSHITLTIGKLLWIHRYIAIVKLKNQSPIFRNALTHLGVGCKFFV